jgi:hypothetical protein
MCCLDLIQIMNYSLSIMHLDAAGNISNSSNPYYCNYIGGAPRSCRAVVFKEWNYYDNASTDVGEGVEVAGNVGADLAGWSIILIMVMVALPILQ